MYHNILSFSTNMRSAFLQHNTCFQSLHHLLFGKGIHITEHCIVLSLKLCWLLASTVIFSFLSCVAYLKSFMNLKVNTIKKTNVGNNDKWTQRNWFSERFQPDCRICRISWAHTVNQKNRRSQGNYWWSFQSTRP